MENFFFSYDVQDVKPVPEKTNLATFQYRIADYPGVVKQEFERGWLVYDPQH